MESQSEEQIESCSQNVISCDFYHVGCEVKLPSKDMPDHLGENMIVHLSLLAKKHVEIEAENQMLKNKFELLTVKNLQLKASLRSQTSLQDMQAEIKGKAQELNFKLEKLQAKRCTQEKDLKEFKTKRRQIQQDSASVLALPYMIPYAPPIITMTNFQQHKTSNKIWFSAPMYTDHHKYKICLGIIANDIDFFGVAEDPRASLFVYFMRGEFDDHLQWPFRGTISFTLQVDSQTDYIFTFVYNSEVPDAVCSRVTDGERATTGQRSQDSIAHVDLEPCLQNDSLFFQLHTT